MTTIRRQITSVRDQLVSEHLGVSVDDFESAMREAGRSCKAVEDTSRGRQDAAAIHRADSGR